MLAYRSLYVFIVGLSLFAAHSSARELYVSGTGSLNATGTEQDPIINIRVAVGRAITGDTIVLFPGTYTSRDIEVYDAQELHFRALDPNNRPVIQAAMRIGDDTNVFTPPFIGSISDLVFYGTRHLRMYGQFVSFIVRNCDFIQQNTNDAEAIRITHVNKRNTPGVRFENCRFSRIGEGPALVTRDYLDYVNRGYLNPDVRDWAPLVLQDSSITGGGLHLPVRVGVYGGRNVLFSNITASNNAAFLISNSTGVTVTDSRFVGSGIKFSQDSRRVLISNSEFSRFGLFNYQGEERPVSLTWNPRGVGNIADVTITNCKFSNYTKTSNRTNSFAAIHIGRPIEAPFSISNFVISGCDFESLGPNQWAITSHNEHFDVIASSNWWGSSAGPTSCCNPKGTGPAVTNGTIWTPVCTSSDCLNTTSIDLACQTCNVAVSPTAPSSGMPDWMLIVIIVSVGAAMLIVILFFIWCRMRSRKPKDAGYIPLAGYDPDSFQSRLRANPGTVEELIQQCNLKFIEFSRLHINPVCIGSGSFGSVFEAVLDPEPTKGKSSRPKSRRGAAIPEDHVAVKLLNQNVISSIDGFKQFLDEIKIQSLIDHPNVLALRGLSIDPRSQQLLLITPLMSRGSLEDIVLKRKENLSPALKLKVATDIAYAMHYLHSKETSIVHRDLKLSNVLVDKNWCCKVSDFGVAKTLDKKAQTATIKGTPIYLAPESISVGRFSEKTDVFSFGITLWELWAQQRAYDDVDGSTANLLYRIAIEGLRPPIPADCPARLATLLRDMFSADADQRPTFTEILEVLSDIQFDAVSEASTSSGSGKPPPRVEKLI